MKLFVLVKTSRVIFFLRGRSRFSLTLIITRGRQMMSVVVVIIIIIFGSKFGPQEEKK